MRAVDFWTVQVGAGVAQMVLDNGMTVTLPDADSILESIGP